MDYRNMLLGLMAASAIGAMARPAQAEIIVNIAPPAPRYETVPAPRAGYHWETGYWRWSGNRHVWVAGHWVAARPGYVYSGPRWVERDGRWVHQSRRWDRDGDGISDRRDRDRDGDGVPNRRDARPDNPNRS